MKNLQMVDLKTQYQHIKAEVNTAVLNVLESAAFINGPEVKDFESNLKTYLQVNHVIPCANGTDALQIAMMALGLQQGDEVIVPAFTYVATAEVIALLQLTPVMVDVDPKTFNITPEIFEAAITSRTKAVVPVHLFGQSADMEGIMTVAKKHNIYVIEDNAQAIGGDFIFSDGIKQKTGTIGHIGCTSFFPSKNLGCYGDGGAMMTNDDELASKMRMIASHGQSKLYHHAVVGVNSRLDSVQAAILNIKLRHLDTYNQHRRAAADFYDHAIADLSEHLITPFRHNNNTHVFHQYTLQVRAGSEKRWALKEFLAEKGIPSMVYYPVPLHQQAAFASFSTANATKFNVTENLCNMVISLPMHSELDTESLGYIVKNIKYFFLNI